MALVINTNIASLSTQRRLNQTTKGLDRAFRRLSTGLRVNSAADDAAGLAITTRFTAQIRGLNTAVRNANDGVSMVQTAEGALQETTAIVQRMRELTVQAATDTNTDSDRQSIQAEVDQLLAEIDRIAEDTTFNDRAILNGKLLGARFHVGGNADESLDISTVDARTQTLGRQARADGAAVDADEILLANDLAFNGTSVRASVAADDLVSTSGNAASAIAKAAAINDSAAFTGVRALVNATRVGGGDIQSVVLDTTNFITINGQAITGVEVTPNDATGALRDAINAVSRETGVTATLDARHHLELTAQDGRNIQVETAGSGAGTGLTDALSGGSLTLLSEDLIEIDFTADANGKVGFYPVVAFGGEAPFDLEPLDVLRLDVNDTGDADAVFDGIAERSRSAAGTFDLEPGQALTVRIDGGVNQSFAFNAVAAKQRSIAGPFDLEPGQTLVVSADGGGNQTVTFTATAEVQRSAGGPFDLEDGETLDISIDGGAAQTVVFNAAAVADIDAVTRAEAAGIIAAEIAGAQAQDDGTGVRITSNIRGSSSAVQIVGGTAAAAFGFAEIQAGGGNVQNIDAVGAGGAAAAIDAGINGASAFAEGQQVAIASATRGTASTMTVGGGTAAGAFGFALAEAGAGDVADIDAVTRAEALAKIDAGLTDATLIDDGVGLVITSDVRGTLSSVVVGGAASPAFGFNEIQAGDGNVGNIDAVTFAEFEQIVEGAFALVDAAEFGNSATLAVSGAGATLDIDAASAGAFGFEVGPVLIVGDGRALIAVTSDRAIESTDVTTRAAANEALETLDLALKQLSQARSGLGAQQNRLTSTLATLTTASENLSAARGRILDAEFGQETALLAREQILSSAGLSVLAQANQAPSIALSLLAAI